MSQSVLSVRSEPERTSASEQHPPPHHQPLWEHRDDVDIVRSTLREAPPIVSPQEIDTLRYTLARAAKDAVLIQAGDCVEELADATVGRTSAKAADLIRLGELARGITGAPAILVGRIGGQYAKPRSAPFETKDGKTFMTFRGPIVHAPEADERRRAGNVHRIATCRLASEIVTATLRTIPAPGFLSERLWTSHEALLLDYEASQIRTVEGREYLTSTAWPWLGNRTRAVDGPHVSLAAGLVNPVSVKVSGDLSPTEVLRLARTLNPRNEPGKLSFIARYGAARIGELAPLVAATVQYGVEVRWITDPMHGNTFTNFQGVKTRRVDDVLAEAVEFARIVRAHGARVGGIHLETTPDDVQESVWRVDEVIDPSRYTTGCDPRLNPQQSQYVLERWLEA